MPRLSGAVRRAVEMLAVGFACLAGHSVSAAIPAFPGAEGAGAYAAGGRGGDVYYVTNTNNTGAGSLRNGITGATGPRTILFKISGTIDLASNLSINKPNLTIAGQTAPGDGITLRRRLTSVQNTHDVVLRFIRCRAGDLDSTFQDDSFHVVNGTNVIVDHVSASWSVDECLSVTWSTNVTIQWCLISESLKNSQHDKGAHGYGTLLRYGAGDLTFHHNLYQHHDSRNPRLGDRIKLDFVNNVIYNWGGRAGYSGNSADLADNPGGFTNYLNYVGNYLVAGPSSTTPNTAFASGETNTVIYQSENRIDSNKNTLFDGIDTGWGMFNSFPYTSAGARFPLPPVATDPAPTAYQRVLAFGGASVVRDAVDVRLLGTVRNHTGRLVDAVGSASQATDYVTNNINGTNYVFVRGWPELNSTEAPTDADNDGIPNYFETALRWNPAAPNNNHTNSDGYTDLEWYLNWLAEPHAVVACNQSLTLNLRALTGQNVVLAFSAIDATNGTATLLDDGFTAQFIPPTNFIGFARFTVVASNAVDRASLGSIPVTILVSNVPPTILADPAARTNEVGTVAVFTVTASGGDLSYQWRRGALSLTNGGNVSGAKGPSLTLSNVAPTDAGDYHVYITNVLGTATSASAALVVRSNTPPTLQPVPDRSIVAGQALVITNIAGDIDEGQALSFELAAGPEGASLGLTDGIFSWRPLMVQADSTNAVQVIVRDDGNPSLSATQSFEVRVIAPIPPLTEASVFGSQLQLAVTGDSGPDYSIQASTNLVDWVTVFTTNSPATPYVWTGDLTSDLPLQFYRIRLGP